MNDRILPTLVFLFFILASVAVIAYAVAAYQGCLCAPQDVNCDGAINVQDVQLVINAVLEGK